jgi:ammonia channel protein AmtB
MVLRSTLDEGREPATLDKCGPKAEGGSMKGSSKHKLLRLILGAALVSAGWFFFKNAESVGAELFGCSYQTTPTKSERAGVCLGISTAKRRTTEAVGIALVAGGIVVVGSLLDYGSKG